MSGANMISLGDLLNVPQFWKVWASTFIDMEAILLRSQQVMKDGEVMEEAREKHFEVIEDKLDCFAQHLRQLIDTLREKEDIHEGIPDDIFPLIPKATKSRLLDLESNLIRLGDIVEVITMEIEGYSRMASNLRNGRDIREGVEHENQGV